MGARKRKMPGQSSLSGIDWGQFDDPIVDEKKVRKAHDVAPVARYRPGRKLHTPAVFTQDEERAPTPWHQMGSSRVMAARYDPANQQVQVYFRDGTPWVYEDVPEQVYSQFITSTSAGRFVHQVLDLYPYRRPDSSEMGNW